MSLTVALRPGGERRVSRGHAWVFADELAVQARQLPPGGVVSVVDARGRFIGQGLANPASLIAIRLLSRDRSDDLDSVGFYEQRLAQAWRARAAVLPGRQSVRVVSGDGDGLSGLVLDRYQPLEGGGPIVVAQLTSLGLDQRRELLQQAVQAVLSPAGGVLRNDLSVRALEGLPQQVETWFGEVPAELSIAEGAARFRVDPFHGQKTGFFLDQVENRAWGAARCGGCRVLDAYAHTGAWAVQALLAGASSAVAVDSSPRAAELIARHGQDNGLGERLRVIQGDARQVMETMAREGQRFERVMIDPPAFAKSRKDAGAALRGYRQVNRLALQLVTPGGLLFSSSCSHHIEEERFLGEILIAAAELGLSLRLVRRGEQGPDHPVHPSMPETRYLKHLVFRVEAS